MWTEILVHVHSLQFLKVLNLSLHLLVMTLYLGSEFQFQHTNLLPLAAEGLLLWAEIEITLG